MQIQHHKGAAAILVSQHFGVPPKLGMGKAQGQPPPPPPDFWERFLHRRGDLEEGGRKRLKAEFNV